MSDNTDPQKDLLTIRDILMGKDMANYAERFKQIDELFLTTERANTTRFEQEHQFIEKEVANINRRIDQLTLHTNQRLDALTLETNERFSRLEKLVETNVDALNERVSKVSTQDKAELGKMLSIMAQRLASED